MTNSSSSISSTHQSSRHHRRRRRHTPVLGAAAVALLVGLAATPAFARGKLIDLHGSVLAGGMTGRGSDSTTPDLFHQTEGAGFGLELGARLLVLDFSMRFLQMVNTGGSGGTMLTALLGPSIEIPITGGGIDSNGKQRPPELVIRPGVAGGLCFGTLGPVDPPLTNDQLAGKGLLLMGRFAVERMFGPILGVGAELQGGYHYLVGASGVANGKDTSSGWQVGLFGTVSFHLGV